MRAKNRVTPSTQSTSHREELIRERPMNLTTRMPVLAALATTLALTFVGDALAQSRDKPSRHFEDALRRFENNDLAGAAIQLRSALQQDPMMLAAHVLLGRTELARGDAPAAESAFAKAFSSASTRRRSPCPWHRPCSISASSSRCSSASRPKACRRRRRRHCSCSGGTPTRDSASSGRPRARSKTRSPSTRSSFRRCSRTASCSRSRASGRKR